MCNTVIARNFKFNLISWRFSLKIFSIIITYTFHFNQLKIEKEDHLFQIISKLIKEDKDRILLLKTIHFEFDSSHLLTSFFENISIDEIDFEVFESLK
jgi:hypothetical protein